MSITPQTIKDQEFQIKFRGYDTIEVKAYLDLVAEEFFELLEVKRRQEEEYAELNARYQGICDEKDTLEQAARDTEAYSGESRKEQMAREVELADLQKKADRFEGLVKELETEKAALLFAREGREKELAEEVTELREKTLEQQQDLGKKDSEIERLRLQLTTAEKLAEELKKDEMVFKSTIIAAQSFADDLRRKTETEAQEMLARARTEVEDFRQKAQQELAHLPKEIEQLHRQRQQVREELKTVLQSYLDRLDSSEGNSLATDGNDLQDLFQTITLPDVDGSGLDALDAGLPPVGKKK